MTLFFQLARHGRPRFQLSAQVVAQVQDQSPQPHFLRPHQKGADLVGAAAVEGGYAGPAVAGP